MNRAKYKWKSARRRVGNGETGRLPGRSIVLQTRACNDNDDGTRYNTVSVCIVAQRRRNLPLKGMFAQGKFALPFSAADAASTNRNLLCECGFLRKRAREGRSVAQ